MSGILRIGGIALSRAPKPLPARNLLSGDIKYVRPSQLSKEIAFNLYPGRSSKVSRRHLEAGGQERYLPVTDIPKCDPPPPTAPTPSVGVVKIIR